jgi:hypothetical protein
VEALRAEDHAYVVAAVEQRQRLQIEAGRCHLQARLQGGLRSQQGPSDRY